MKFSEKILKFIKEKIENISSALTTVTPLLLESLFNQSVSADTNFFSSYLTPSYNSSTFRIYACFDTSGILSVVKKIEDTEIVIQLNSGRSLNANCLYAFDIATVSGEEINFRYSVDAIALDVKVYEVGASIS